MVELRLTPGSLSLMIRNFSRGMASIKNMASYISKTSLFLQKYHGSILEHPISKMKV